MASSQIIYNLVARDHASRTFNQVGESSRRLRSGLGKLGTALKGAAAGIGVTSLIGAESVKAAADFQTQMTRVRTSAGELAGNMKMVSAGVLDMAGDVGVSAHDLAVGLYGVESAGYHGADGLKVLRDAAEGAKVGAADMGVVADVVTTALNAYKLGAGSATKVTNLLIGAEVEGKATMEDLAGSLSTVLPTAATAKIGLTEVLGAMSALTAQGTPAKQAATYLRQTIAMLSSPSAKAANEMKNLGLSATKVGLNLGEKGLASTLTMLTDAIEKHMGPAGTVLIKHLQGAAKNTTEFQKVLANLPPTQQTYIGALATMVGGTKSMQAALELTGPHMEDFRKKTDKIAEHAREGGDKIEGWSDVQKTFNQQLAQAKDGLGALAIKIGTKALPVLTKIVGYIAKTAVPALARFATTVSHKLRPAFDFVKAGLKGLGGSSPVGTGSLAQVQRYAKKVRTAVAGAFSKVKDTIRGAFGKIDLSKVGSQFTTAAKSWAGNLIKGVKTGVDSGNWKPLGVSIGHGLVGAVKGLASLAKKITSAIGDLMGKVDWVGIGISVGKEAPLMLVGLAAGILNIDLGGLLKGLASHWQDILLAILAVAFAPAKWLGKIGELLAKIPFVGKLLKWGLDVFAKFSKGLVKAVGKALSFLGKAFLDGFRKVFPGIGKNFTKWLGLLPTRVGVAAIEVGQKALALVKGLGNGIARGFGWVASKIGELIGHIVKPFAKAHLWLIEKGIAVVKGLLRGAGRIAKTVGGWLKAHVVNPALRVFTRAGSWLLDKGAALITGLKNGVVRIAKTVGGWLKSHVVHPVTSTFSRAGHWLVSAGGHLLSGLKSGITTAIKGVGRWVKSHIVDPVVNAVKHFFGIHSPSTVFAELGGHLIGGLLKGMAATGGTAIARHVFGDMPSALGAIVSKGLVSIGSLPGKALKALGNLGGKLLGLLGLGGGGSGRGGGVSQWAGYVQTVLAMLGAPSSALSAVLTRIGIESGGNPHAINNWDSNALAGHPSQGLMQTIPGTFAAYAGPFRSRGITDPLANIYAGVNYAMHRYGKNWMKVMTRPGGYDSGGLAMDAGYLPKYTNQPERVLSPRQTVAFERLVDVLDRGGADRAPIQVHLHVNDPLLRDLITAEVRQGQAELITALDAGRL